ncbi:MAG: hypothetical protein UT98_C0001G0157 [Candidatus Nomurabacteria bacterium GW2011_GWF2_40_31]|uniref:Uncharacterized protein n=2 Tax=Candidatus Nomuraibacteriota TaxID=1752729 RepID=A0A837HU21_9BACT|nr:MAG: hypothetical protein UT27_C0001G0011 [Candidatus Nomurabacteria bacterium GW2011_GWD2_39_12]KKR20722.1 MAG: hypothetical protein UT51_C0002G0157 [Candidatus Nomurabacteria bacterium GW2011_GWC2_39_41]KKR37350.1 MAG: hypothetical protein UT70_C0001G0026 [Candidatus Nomurabacteria bacterium GW2011_GWE2_40_10]KKR38597.1 MAG: hypothetical protein UT73_C0002G0082 [Candidatus Nomurabacteria bacterium GW2011_GWB1_40_11]KKR40322.1 MAG: hypothetical protein UT74_C0001G0056 [Parcubacteria group b
MHKETYCKTHTVLFSKNMNDTTELKDCLISDEIQRIQTLSREELTNELITLKTERIEVLTNDELFKLCRQKNYENGN